MDTTKWRLFAQKQGMKGHCMKSFLQKPVKRIEQMLVENASNLHERYKASKALIGGLGQYNIQKPVGGA